GCGPSLSPFAFTACDSVCPRFGLQRVDWWHGARLCCSLSGFCSCIHFRGRCSLFVFRSALSEVRFRSHETSVRRIAKLGTGCVPKVNLAVCQGRGEHKI
ncbi:hypothetical protein T310_8733, partial [Rasamsonia emersonii CBS 393.64]